ncbi:MAG: ferredoxin [Bacteroidia bacterium]
MIQIIHFRNKCIGCNACVEADAANWRMSRRDGKSVLIGATEKKQIYQIKFPNEELEAAKRAELVCPVKIIQVKEL